MEKTQSINQIKGKRLKKKKNIVYKGVETRNNKVDQEAKVKPNVRTPKKSRRRVDQQTKVKLDVGTPDKPGIRSSRKTRELESMQNIVDGRQATILEFTPKK